MTHEPHHLTGDAFSQVDMRVGTILDAQIFKEAQRPSLRLEIDFGILGIKKSSAQIRDLYRPEEVIGKQIVAVVNFPLKQIATMMSECLVLGVIGARNEVTLLQPDRPVENGDRIG